MNILKMATSYLNPVQPSYLILFVTSKCNARCSFCFYSNKIDCKTRKNVELSTEEFRKISEKCGNIPYLLISGGEPVLRDDLGEIIGFFIENANTQFVTVPSNGLSPERTERLFSELTLKYPKCHFRAAFSLDFHDQRHDVSRGVNECIKSVNRGAMTTPTAASGGVSVSQRKAKDRNRPFAPRGGELDPPQIKNYRVKKSEKQSYP